LRWTKPTRNPVVFLTLTFICACGGDRAEVAREWSVGEDLRIGGSGNPDQTLSRVGGVLSTPDGGVWVLQPIERDIRVYGPDGSLLRHVGEGGEGPGQFTLPNRMGWWGSSFDTVWVADLGLRRVSLFTVAGDFVSSMEMPFVQHESVYSVNQPGAVRSDTSALALAAYSPLVTDWETFPVLRYDLAQGRVDEQLAALDRTSSVMVRWQDKPITSTVHPVSDAPLVAFSHDGGRVVIVERGTDFGHLGSVGVVAVSAEGDTLWSRSLPYAPDSLPQAEVDSLIAPRLASLQQFARLEGSMTEYEAEQAYRASVQVPEHRPPVQAVHFALDGRVWLAWAAAPGQPERWSVLSADGDQTAFFTAAASLDARSIGSDFLWALEVHENIPSLVRYRTSELPR
jgi:hypothetical protein